MLARAVFLGLVLGAASLRVQQRALELLNTTGKTKTSLGVVYTISDECVLWAGGHGSVRYCFPLTATGSHKDWVQVLQFMVLHPYRCINGVTPETEGGEGPVVFGDETLHTIVPYRNPELMDGEFQVKCLYGTEISPIKPKAFLDPFNLWKFPLQASTWSVFGGGTLYQWLHPFFFDPARIKWYADTCSNINSEQPGTDQEQYLMLSAIVTGPGEGGYSLVSGGLTTNGNCYEVQFEGRSGGDTCHNPTYEAKARQAHVQLAEDDVCPSFGDAGRCEETVQTYEGVSAECAETVAGTSCQATDWAPVNLNCFDIAFWCACGQGGTDDGVWDCTAYETGTGCGQSYAAWFAEEFSDAAGASALQQDLVNYAAGQFTVLGTWGPITDEDPIDVCHESDEFGTQGTYGVSASRNFQTYQCSNGR